MILARTAAVSPALALCLLASAAAHAAIECGNASGALAVRITIETPDPGVTIAPDSPCGGTATITGTFFVKTPPPVYDFYIVLDTSGSTRDWAESDVDGDGVSGPGLDLPDDSIYRAEILAAQEFIRACDPAASRAAVISFASTPTLRQELTADLAAVDAALEAMKAQNPGGGTNYIPAMQAVETELLARGDPSGRRQRCVFLSDGETSESDAGIDTAAQRLADLTVVMDTFALGSFVSDDLMRMAAITGGSYTQLATPGDIVAMLPTFVPNSDYDMSSRNDTGGNAGDVVTDDTSMTFTATVQLVPGTNHVVLRLETLATPFIDVECAIDLEMPDPLVADAGADQAACAGTRVLLDGSNSEIPFCARPLHRWLDCTGAEVCPPGDDPTCFVDACAGCDTFVLEVSCEGLACSKTDSVVAQCLPTPVPSPSLVRVCGLDADVACGVVDPSARTAWDLDPTDDADGNGDPADDEDLPGCDVTISFATTGPHAIRALGTDPATGCVGGADLVVVVPEALPAGVVSGGACPGADVVLTCGTADPLATYWWDLDASVDSDLDGDPANDADADGCDVTTSWAAVGAYAVRAWERDAAGCVRLAARGLVVVSPTGTPGESSSLRVTKSLTDLELSWAAAPGASASRVLRGTLDSLWLGRTYDHAADDASGIGACLLVAQSSFVDPDDILDASGFYYLVTGYNDCGGEGGTGFAWDGTRLIPRPGRLPTASCP